MHFQALEEGSFVAEVDKKPPINFQKLPVAVSNGTGKFFGESNSPRGYNGASCCKPDRHPGTRGVGCDGVIYWRFSAIVNISSTNLLRATA